MLLYIFRAKARHRKSLSLPGVLTAGNACCLNGERLPLEIGFRTKRGSCALSSAACERELSRVIPHIFLYNALARPIITGYSLNPCHTRAQLAENSNQRVTECGLRSDVRRYCISRRFVDVASPSIAMRHQSAAASMLVMRCMTSASTMS